VRVARKDLTEKTMLSIDLKEVREGPSRYLENTEYQKEGSTKVLR
jgi:hypothetical protein